MDYASPKLISNFYWCRLIQAGDGGEVQNSFRISTDVDWRPRRWSRCPKLISNFYWCRSCDHLGAEGVQNSFRISTDVDLSRARRRLWVQNSFRISTDVDRMILSSAVCPKLISNFYWCRFYGSRQGGKVQNSFRISTDVDIGPLPRTLKSKTHFEFLLM